MKRHYLFLLLFAFLLLPYLSEGKSLWAFLTYSTFNSPEGPYVETYLSVAGNSVKYVRKDNGKFQATVNILMTFKQDGTVKAFKKYELNSPEIDDTTKNNYEFLDEQRFQIPNGSYDFEFVIADKNKDKKTSPFTQTITVNFPADKPCISGIQLIKSYTKSDSPKTITKSGYDLVPYVYNFFPVTEEKLSFYCELYNIDKSVGDGQKFALSYYVESFENNIQFPDMARIRKETARPVNVVLAEFNIHSLPTGNYNIVVEARNPNNEVIATKKVFFQRSNPTAQISYTEMLTNSPANTFVDRIINLDSLREYISCTFPISSGIERAFIKNALKTSDLKSMQEYFLGFWLRRDPNNPEKAWIAYKAQVDKAQANFGTKIKKGYQTDRGRVYLEYGAPNVRSTQYNEPNSYPYEIWQYYSMTNNNQRNRKFVFYSPDMVTSDFFLLHSDAIGEVNNPHWMIDLQGRTYSPSNVQDNDQLNNWGGFAKDYWDLPN